MVHAGVGVVSLFGCVLFGPIYAQQCLGAKATDSIPPQVSRNELIRLLYSLGAGQSVAYLINATRQDEKCKVLHPWCDAVRD